VSAAHRPVIGWDVGGAHLKACLLQAGQVLDVAEWACPLWLGLDTLDRALDQALARWPLAADSACADADADADTDTNAEAHATAARNPAAHSAHLAAYDAAHPIPPHHAVTMTGEMADFFADRQDGVQRIAALMRRRLGPGVRFFAGRAGWVDESQAASQWAHIASANWLATVMHAAQAVGSGVLVDIGSTTTDLVAFQHGRVHTHSRSDADRLASGELVYHGVVRTPLCAVARRIRWRGRSLNVMNEFFATSADVYRLTGELNPAHDLHPSADNGPKDTPGTHARLARMVGLDARDGTADDWRAFAQAWRTEQLAELAGQLDRVLAAAALPADAPIVSAGCGDFLAQALAQAAGRPCLAYGTQVARAASGAPPNVPGWAQVCAPSVAVACLWAAAGRNALEGAAC
jgi:probable H4MPT-linked C1 transfer pathway protein